jgi:ABC-type proline/glycine betaine transport system permease subunit
MSSKQNDVEKGQTFEMNHRNVELTAKDAIHDHAAETSQVIWSALYSTFYCIASISMVAVNKAVVSNYQFSYTCFLLILQSLATLAIAEVVKWKPKFSPEIAKKLFPLSIIYLVNVCFGLLAVRLLSIPVYTVIKRLTPLPTLVLDYFIRSKTQPPLALVGVLLLILGPIILAQGDLDYNLFGYLVGLGAVGFQALFLIAVSWNNDSGISETDLSWYNSLLTIPPLIIAMCIFESDVLNHKAWSETGFIPFLIVFALLGATFLFSTILLTSRCSALSLTVVGQVKGLLQIYIGFLWFGEVRLLREGFVGIALSTLGAAIYAYAKFRRS